MNLDIDIGQVEGALLQGIGLMTIEELLYGPTGRNLYATLSSYKVTDIHITIGQLSSIVDDSIQFYWDMLSEDTICSAAKLHFNRIPAEFFCTDCKKTFKLEQELAPCPYCGSIRLRITSGEEFFLESIEIQRNESE